MKKILLASVATLATVSAFSALAADLPSRKAAPAYTPPPPMWTGFYAGLNAGYNFGTNSNVYSQNWAVPEATPAGVTPTTFISVAPISMDGIASNTQSGFIGGAQFGYNYQYGANFLLGVEADIQGTNTRGASRTGGLAQGGAVLTGLGLTVNQSETSSGSTVVQGGLDYLGTIRGRLGYLWTPTLLVYGTGGFAYGGAWANVGQTSISSLTTTVTAPPPGAVFGPFAASWLGGGRQNQLLTGWTAGGGLEWMFMPNWSLKGEALYWDLGRMNVQTAAYEVAPVNPGLAWGRTSVNYSGVQAKVGINYHFNWGSAPVVASY